MATFTLTPPTHVASDLVTARFGMSEDLVNTYDAASSGAIDALAAATFSVPMENLDLEITSISPPTIGEAPTPNAVTPYVSQAQEVVLSDLAALRASLGLVDVTIAQTTLPSLEAISPSVLIPDAPDDAIPDVPGDMPSLTEPVIPASPQLDMPTLEALLEVVVPIAPSLENLSFTEAAPTADLTAPEPMFVYNEGTYQSDLADAIKTKLYNDVTLGGTGLGADVEAAIWARALSRLDVELVKAYNQVLTNWEQWNMEMPDGVLSSALQEALNEDARNRLDQNRDITIEQARLAQQNTQFAITSGMVFEKQIMDYTNQVAQRAFEAAKFQVQAVIDAFNLKVNAFNARLEGYKVLAQVFEARIRAELARADIFKTQMEGAKLQGELQMQKVAVYTARVQALETVINLFKAQMEGARLQTEIDKNKIELAKAKIEAVVAQIGGITAKFNLYQAKISGEVSKVELYGKQVTAYATQVSAAKVVSEVNTAEMQAKIEQNKDRISVLTAALDKYKADTQYELGKDETGAKVYSAQMGGFEAEVGRESEYIKSKVEIYKGQINQIAASAELVIKEMDANLRAATASKEIQMEALKAVANLFTQKVASALTSVSANAQVGFNESLSQATQQSESDSYSQVHTESHSEQFEEVHTYREK